MSEIKHVPGPWQWDDDEVWQEGYDTEQHAPWLVGPEGERILTGQIHCLSEADGRLIASAPDLLEALDRLQNAIDQYFGPSKVGEAWPTFFDSQMRAARAAIAKAGSQP